MYVRSKIQKWGNGLALRISGPLRDVPGFREGVELEIQVTENGLFVKKAKIPSSVIFSFTEAELLEDLDPNKGHVDLLANLLPSEQGD